MEPVDAELRIREAALELFSSRNFSVVTIKDIAKAAGLNTALIYYYFGSKEELFRSAVTLAVERAFHQFRIARRDLKVISPYFVPGSDGVEWLGGMVRDGVEVGILTNSLAANDVMAVHGGYARYRVPLLEAGVELFELKAHGEAMRSSLFGSSGASLHTKAFVVDGAHGFIGSFNLDPRSMNLNTEMGLLFESPGAAAELERLYAAKISAPVSYRLALADGALRWHDEAASPPYTWDREPDASLWRRGAARVIGWLPVESQL